VDAAGQVTVNALGRSRQRLWNTPRNVPSARFLRVIDFAEIAGPSVETTAGRYPTGWGILPGRSSFRRLAPLFEEADLIHHYTRAETITDSLLVDVCPRPLGRPASAD
jgi:hypothetical protein